MFYVGRAFREASEKMTPASISERMRIPTIAMAPIIASLEKAGLLQTTEQEELVPGREMTRIRLQDILDVVRVEGETGSHRDPRWSEEVDSLADSLDGAVATVIADRTLADFLDAAEK